MELSHLNHDGATAKVGHPLPLIEQKTLNEWGTVLYFVSRQQALRAKERQP